MSIEITHFTIPYSWKYPNVYYRYSNGFEAIYVDNGDTFDLKYVRFPALTEEKWTRCITHSRGLEKYTFRKCFWKSDKHDMELWKTYNAQKITQ